MDYTELLFAAEVRKLAAGLKARDAGIHYKTLPDDEYRSEKLDKWSAEQLTIDFVPEALAMLKAVAAIIKAQP